jgi:DNA-binding transcriptional ArsR family regulator
MKYFVEDNGENKVVYKSLLVDDPTSLSVLANKTALNLIKELSKKPLCAMDLARRLGLHEQKVYYNLRRLQKAGIIKLLRTEERTGGTAKIYSLVEPVISVKLADNAFLSIDTKVALRKLDLLRPFVENGKLNAKIVFGDPYPHGKFDAGGLDGCYISDLNLFLGSFTKDVNFPAFSLDIQMRERDLKDNLIIVGSPKGNTITYKLNSFLPIYFDENTGWTMVSRITGRRYDDDFGGVVEIIENPFKKDKKIMVLAGKRTRGTMAAVLAFTKHFDEVMSGNIKDRRVIARVVHGTDSNGDGYVDDV